MANPVTTSGARVAISSVAVSTATDTLAEFAALTWIEVGLVETIGDFGDEAPLVNFTAISANRVFKTKGANDAGEMTLTCAHDPTDAGQVALVAAQATKFNYGFRIVLPDNETASMSNTIVYFRGLVRSQRFNPGGNDSILKRVFAIPVNSSLVISGSISV